MIGTECFFRVKPDGRFKARLVALGWRQRHGIDCGNTFAPVCRFDNQRLLLALAVAKDWRVISLDVQTAFLNGVLDKNEQVFVKQAPGFESTNRSGESLVMKLEKSLYGLKQAPHVWNATIDNRLKLLGFNSLRSDPCVYIRGCRESFVMLTLYVDGILVTGGSNEAIDKVRSTLMTEFSMSDLGDVSETLGIHINRDLEAGTISLSQEKYAEAILERFGMKACKPVSTPGTGRELVGKPEGSEYLDEKETKEYQALIGSLIFLTTNTRFDIAFAVMQSARFMSKPTSGHMIAAKRILWYLRGVPDLRITYSRSGNKELLGYSYSSYYAT